MLITLDEDSYVITQRQADGHTYCVAEGRVYSNLAEARRVHSAMLTAFEQLVPPGQEGAWHRPELRAVKWL